MGLGGGNSEFSYGILAFSLAIMILLPLFLGIFAPTAYNGVDEDELLSGYERMTGQSAAPKVSVWPLTGIYTPFTGAYYDEDAQQTITYGRSADGWLFGTEIKSYPPSQYQGTPQAYTTYKADDGVFRYWSDSKDYNADLGTGHKGRVVENGTVTYPGDLYTEVSFDVNHKSDIFFVESSKKTMGDYFTFDYTGYRLSFQPISNYTTVDQDGTPKPVIATTTSLSLIWYTYAAQSGISGQLVLSGSDSGTAYLNAAQVVSAFNPNTSVAPFDMVFNGVKMTIYIKIDPVYLNQGWTVQDCYNGGYWSVMVTSLSTDSTAYTGTDNATNPMQIFETMIDLLTFNLEDYNISSWLQYICYFVFIAPLYVGLIVLCLDNAYLWVLVGLLAAIQALGSWWPF